MVLIQSCSTQKNTALSRSFHSTKVKYNILYNGNNAYEEGLKMIASAHEENYQQVIPLYPVSDHKAAESSKSKMDLTIEKCRKCIKLHSIKKRPKVNSKKSATDEKYRAWLKHEEFNPSMHLAWLRLGQAEFHKGDFLGSIGTFNYIQRHYSYDKDLVAQCQLWSVRAYAEMGWIYEAEDLLQKVQIDDLSRKHASLYSAAAADLMMKQERWREAIPHVKIAKEDEKRKQNRPRFEYALGQLYELQGNNGAAAEAYRRCIKLTPVWDMDFNARVRLSQLMSDQKQALKDLDRMIRLDKYKEYLDRLYGAKGDILLRKGDTLGALEQYAKAAEESTRMGTDKAAALIKAGDIYFQRREYAKAQPCYADALTIISAGTDDYKRLSKRSEVLDGLVLHQTTVELQDSLQRLAKLSPEEQLRVCEKIVADLIEQERQDSIRAAEAARRAANDEMDGPTSVNTTGMLGGNSGSTEWYFYNPNLLRSGKQQFRTRWGNRKLADNWRRMIQGSPIFSDEKEEEEQDSDVEPMDGDSLPTAKEEEQPVVTDVHDPMYYLQQIPKTDEELAQSDTLIAGSLAALVGIYRNELEDEALTQETFDELCRRYPDDSHLLDLYYTQYLRAMKDSDQLGMARYRGIILQKYPNSSYATVVSDPLYFQKLQQQQQLADSLFEATYNAYKTADYQGVQRMVAAVDREYPLNTLMPRFLFLDAVATAKTDGQEAFGDKLQTMVQRYPDGELASMAKDMLGMMNRGMESQTGTDAASTLEAARQQLADSLAAEADSVDLTEKQIAVFIVIEKNPEKLNKLLYEVALFNFSKFMIKDFDLQTIAEYSATESALMISGFDAAADSDWYKGMLMDNAELMQTLNKLGAVVL